MIIYVNCNKQDLKEKEVEEGDQLVISQERRAFVQNGLGSCMRRRNGIHNMIKYVLKAQASRKNKNSFCRRYKNM